MIGFYANLSIVMTAGYKTRYVLCYVTATTVKLYAQARTQIVHRQLSASFVLVMLFFP